MMSNFPSNCAAPKSVQAELLSIENSSQDVGKYSCHVLYKFLIAGVYHNMLANSQQHAQRSNYLTAAHPNLKYSERAVLRGMNILFDHQVVVSDAGFVDPIFASNSCKVGFDG